MEATNYSDFRRNLKHYMSQVNEDAEPLLVTAKDDDDNVVVMSKHDFDAIEETLYLLSNPKLMAKSNVVMPKLPLERLNSTSC